MPHERALARRHLISSTPNVQPCMPVLWQEPRKNKDDFTSKQKHRQGGNSWKGSRIPCEHNASSHSRALQWVKYFIICRWYKANHLNQYDGPGLSEDAERHLSSLPTCNHCLPKWYHDEPLSLPRCTPGNQVHGWYILLGVLGVFAYAADYLEVSAFFTSIWLMTLLWSGFSSPAWSSSDGACARVAW